MIGYGFIYNTLDNNKLPTSGLYFNFGQDFAGVGGNVSYLRTTVDVRGYYEVVTDLVSILHLQGGDMLGLANCPQNQCASSGGYVRMLDDFKMGPNLVRGFQPAGFGPRDVTPGTTNDNIGGTMYWGASLEFQYPFYFLPKDAGFRGAVFVDSGSVWGYKGETTYAATGEINGLITPAAPGTPFVCQCGMITRTRPRRARVGRRQHDLGFAVRTVAFRFRLSVPEAELRPDAVVSPSAAERSSDCDASARPDG